MPDSNNIELKLNVNTKDAEKAIDEFSKASDKAFGSSDRKVQQMGVSLDRTVGKMKSVKAEMDKMINTKVPTEEYKNLENRIKDLKREIKTYEREASKAFKGKVETAEYTQLQTIFNDLQNKAKSLEATLKKDYSGKNAFTGEFNAVSKQIDTLESKIFKLKASKAIMEASGASRTDVEAYQDVINKINDYQRAIDDAKKAQLRLMMGGKHMVDPQGYSAVSRELREATNQMNIADNALKQLEADGQRWDLTAYNEANNKVSELTAELQNAQQAQKMLQAGGLSTQTLASAQPERFNMLQDTMSNLARQGEMFNQSIYRAGSGIDTVRNKTNGAVSAVQRLKSLWSRIRPETRQAGNGVKEFGNMHNMSFKKMLTQVLKYVFGIRSIFLLYKKLRTEIKNGMTSLGKDFPEIQAQINALGNSWWAFKSSLTSAFQPIFSYVIPALVTLIDYLTSAMNALANFFALLTGQGFYYKAVKGNNDFAKSVGGTGAAAKEANEELAEYDKLLVIDQKNAGAGGGGGGGASDADLYNWEKVDTTANSLVEKIQEMWNIVKQAWKDSTILEEATKALKNIKSLIETIGTTFYEVFTNGYGYDWLLSLFNLLGSILGIVGDIAKAFEEAWKENDTGKKLVESIFTTLTNINKMLISIAESFRKAWNDGTGKAICQDILQIITNINNVVGNLASQFTKAWNSAGIGDGIMKGILTIVKDITGFINDITKATADWAAELNFEPILKSIRSVIESIHALLQPILDIAKSIYTDVVLPLVKKLFEKNIPDLLTQIASATASAGQAFKALKPYVEEVLPYIEEIAESGIDAVFKAIGEVIGAIAGELKFIADFLNLLSTIWNSTVGPIVEDIKKALAPFEAILAPIKEFIKLLLQLLGLPNPFDGIADDIEKALKKLVLPSEVQKIMDFFNWYKELSDNGQSNLSKTVTFKGQEDSSFTTTKKDYDSIQNKKAIVTATDNGTITTVQNMWDKITSKKLSITFNSDKYKKFKDKVSKIKKLIKGIKGKTINITAKDKGGKLADIYSMYKALGDKSFTITASFYDNFSKAFASLYEKITGTKKVNKALGGAYYAGLWHDIPQYASGTARAHGSMFIAGEAGPEVVGHVNGRTEVLNRSQIASSIYSAVVGGIKTVLSTIPSFSMSVDLSTLQNLPPIPVVVTGQLLPLTEAFMFKFEEQHKDFEDIKAQLDDIIARLSTVESSNHEPIVLQLDGKAIIKLVWDATEKRYKQTGKPMFA